MPFCWKCGTQLEQNANYCSKCGVATGFNVVPVNANFFADMKDFVIQSYWEDRWDTGCIMDSHMNILAFFRLTESLKPPRTINGRPFPRVGSDVLAVTVDFRIEAIHGGLIGQIDGFLPPPFEFIRRYNYEIYNSEMKLLGVVWEKIRQFGSKWVLENAKREILATIEGNRKKKNYRIINANKRVVARCYRNQGVSEEFYRVKILGSELDSFLVLGYIMVLDRAKRYPAYSYSY